MCLQAVKILPDSRYRLSARVKTEAGSEEVQLFASDYGGEKLSVSSALTEYTEISLEFTSARTAKEMLITLMHPSGPGKGYVDDVQLTRLGDAPPPVVQEFMAFTPRTLEVEGGAAQQPEETLAWFQDAKFGMFIHWGVYSAMPEGSEWVMHQQAFTPEYYRQRAEDPQTGFTAAHYDPADWAKLARTAGMRYMVLTTRHHDGYALFDSQHGKQLDERAASRSGFDSRLRRRRAAGRAARRSLLFTDELALPGLLRRHGQGGQTQRVGLPDRGVAPRKRTA